jgi:ABC-type amino acid transport substrate-binding protein
VAGTRLLLAKVLPDPLTRAEVLAAIKPRGPFAPATVGAELPPVPDPPPAPGTRLDFVRASGRIRVGFDPDSIPWAFVNGDGAPVGFDAELAHQLALALGVRLEHAAVPRERFAEALASGQLDVVMSGLRASPRAAEAAAFSRPYAEEAFAFLVPDHARGAFQDVAAVRARRVRVAILQRPEWIEALARGLPLAEIVPVRSPADFVEGRVQADAMVTSWERACAWSLLYPHFTPALPEPRVGSFSLAYGAPRGEADLVNALDTFIDVQRAGGRLEAARRYWILGEATRVHEPRWSLVRNVFGWWREP